MMRFDDRLNTVLKAQMPSGQAAIIQYRQLVDLLGRRADDALNVEAANRFAAGLKRVHLLARQLPKADQIRVIEGLDGQLKSPILVRYLLGSAAPLANAAIKSARLSDATWAQMVPEMSVVTRGSLRHRRDLGPKTRAALAHYGVSDQLLINTAAPIQAGTAPLNEPAGAEPAKPLEQIPTAPTPTKQALPNGDNSISEIVRKIESFRAAREAQKYQDQNVDPQDTLAKAPNRLRLVSNNPIGDAPQLALNDNPSPDRLRDHPHRIAIDVDGAITQVDDIPIGATFGITVSRPAYSGGAGVDAATASAFARRAFIRSGRLLLAGGPLISGAWRIDAEPQFINETGRFCGYIGIIRRPEPHEDSAFMADDRPNSADTLRQLIHELRTPLGAIIGFSQIIEQQLFGPVAAEYRHHAIQILTDADYLLSGFDDLNTALKLDKGILDDREGQTSTDWLVAQFKDRIAPALARNDSALRITNEVAEGWLAISPQAAERICLRLAATLISLVGTGEDLVLAITVVQPHRAAICFNKPAAIIDTDHHDLLDPDFGTNQSHDNAPLLGIGFTLRLIRNLVKEHDGQLLLSDQQICVMLPMMTASNMDDTIKNAP